MKGEFEREEVKKAIARLKSGKAAGIDGITSKLLKYNGDCISRIDVFICDCA